VPVFFFLISDRKSVPKELHNFSRAFGAGEASVFENEVGDWNLEAVLVKLDISSNTMKSIVPVFLVLTPVPAPTPSPPHHHFHYHHFHPMVFTGCAAAPFCMDMHQGRRYDTNNHIAPTGVLKGRATTSIPCPTSENSA
jgi:hypothetical protein